MRVQKEGATDMQVEGTVFRGSVKLGTLTVVSKKLLYNIKNKLHSLIRLYLLN